jgi:hypothetical protein
VALAPAPADRWPATRGWDGLDTGTDGAEGEMLAAGKGGWWMGEYLNCMSNCPKGRGILATGTSDSCALARCSSSRGKHKRHIGSGAVKLRNRRRQIEARAAPDESSAAQHTSQLTEYNNTGVMLQGKGREGKGKGKRRNRYS